MAIAIGQQLGSYEITALLGKGGMGEVYRATDTKLKREVAIKILPDEFTSDPERLARFQREARVLASLNHPNIAAIYDLQEANDTRFLVLELVEGETLADHIARGRIPVDESLRLAVQIAEALQAAHEKGIIHRDLKPANVKITPDGTVKVLDFGLAKPTGVELSDVQALSNSPTLRTLASSPGMILGTAHYMSPEQAKGRPVDRRTDVFAFGCVLYEMLTGKRAFEGEDVGDTLAAVLRGEPDWTVLPEDVPRTLWALIQRCLAKDRTKRIAEISVAKFLLSEPAFMDAPDGLSARSTTPARRSRLRTTLLIATGALLSAAAAGSLVWTLGPTGPAPVARLTIPLPYGQTFASSRNSNIAISPDGTQLMYATNLRLYRRSLSDFEGKPVLGTENKVAALNPVFSPDGRSVAFYSAADNSIKRIAVDGGTATTVFGTGANSMSWTPKGIVFGYRANIFRISPNGGTPERLVTLNEGEIASGPQILPGGQSILFTLAIGSDDNRWEKAKIVVQSLMTGERKAIIDGGDGRYLPTGHLVYAVGGTVFAVPFDVKQQKVIGTAVPVIQGVQRLIGSGMAHLSVSNTGTLIYVSGPAALPGRARSLIVADRNGSTTTLQVPAAPYAHPRVARDGKHVAVASDDGQDAYVSIYDLSTPSAAMRRLTFEGHNRLPIWSGDSQRVAFQSDREGDVAIFVQRADGASTAERLTKPEQGVSHVPESWSPDGRTLLFSAKKDATFSLWTLSLEDKKIMPFGNVRSAEPIDATFSPDGRWVAYTSNDRAGGTPSPTRGVYVQPFPATGARYQVPKDFNDFHPAWGATTAELFYMPTASRFSVISVQTQPNLTFGKAVVLPTPPTRDRVSSDVREYDVMPDGRFLSTAPADDENVAGTNATPQIRVVLNWFRELQERVPVK